jgi:UDP-3-O-acyl N-acetylglucosamine deacetylase
VPRRTIARAVDLRGIGLHTGATASLTLEPAPAGQGIVFERRDLSGRRRIPARLESVAAMERRTALRNGAHRVDTVEHLLAALYAIGVDDATIAVEGPEVPILDGSFAPFVALAESAGLRGQPGPLNVARVDAPLEVIEGDARYLVESGETFSMQVSLEYAEPVIGQQTVTCEVTADSFCREIQGARTFGFLGEVEALRLRGLLGGATADCAIVLDETSVLNTTLRWPDEFARHKLGDLIGDLALIGTRLKARIAASRPSHRGNIACARAIARAARYTEEA